MTGPTRPDLSDRPGAAPPRPPRADAAAPPAGRCGRLAAGGKAPREHPIPGFVPAMAEVRA